MAEWRKAPVYKTGDDEGHRGFESLYLRHFHRRMQANVEVLYIGLQGSMKVAEREGFEPPVPFDITSFQDWRLKPLGHLSAWA